MLTRHYSPRLWVIRTSLFARATRTGQLMEALLGWGRSGPDTAWRGMEMHSQHRVPASDPRLDRTYAHFRANLDDICTAARGGGAEVALCTVGVNLRTCAPFASVHRADLGVTERRSFEAHRKRGAALEAAGKAAEAYARALAVDDQFAEAHFRRARCCLRAGRAADARRHFQRACDPDARRFRADSRINAVIRDVARRRAGQGVYLVDVEQALARRAGAHGIAGDESFYEHVHLRFEGNHAVAAAVFRAIAERLPPAVAPKAGESADPPDATECAAWTAWTAWSRLADAEAIHRMMLRPPFVGQSTHAEDVAARRRDLEQLRAALTPTALAETEAAFRRAIERDGEDVLARDAFARFLLARGRPAEAAAKWREVLRRLSGHVETAGNLAVALSAQGKPAEAERLCRQALTVWPAHPGLCCNLASALRQQKKIDPARAWYERALEVAPGHGKAHLGLGAIHAAQRRYDQAAAHFGQAAQADPGSAEALEGLSVALIRRQRDREAETHLRKLLSLRPTATAHCHLATVLIRAARTPEAVQHLREAVRLDPALVEARTNLGGQLIATKPQEALVHLAEALRLDPNSASAHGNLGLAYEKLARPDRAMAHYARAVALSPQNEEVRSRLALALLRAGRYGEAADHYRRVLAIRPDRIDALYNLSLALVRARRPREALPFLARAVRLEPSPAGHHDLAGLYSLHGRTGEAIAQYRAALALRPGWAAAEAGLAWELATAAEPSLRDPAEAGRLAASAARRAGGRDARVLDIYAACLAAAGRFGPAAAIAEDALQLAQRNGQNAWGEQIRHRLALYRAHRPYVQPPYSPGSR